MPFEMPLDRLQLHVVPVEMSPDRIELYVVPREVGFDAFESAVDAIKSAVYCVKTCLYRCSEIEHGVEELASRRLRVHGGTLAYGSCRDVSSG